MPISAYKKGYNFERQVVKKLKKNLPSLHPDLRFYIMEARGSHGMADLLLGVEYKGDRTYYGIQCKLTKRLSNKQITERIQRANDLHGMQLVFAWGSSRKVIFYPDIYETIRERYFLSPITGRPIITEYRDGTVEYDYPDGTSRTEFNEDEDV